jgi:hypothetical protein
VKKSMAAIASRMIANKGLPAPGKFWISGRSLHLTGNASLGYPRPSRRVRFRNVSVPTIALLSVMIAITKLSSFTDNHLTLF